NIPAWIIELVLPIGFGLIALRLIWHAASHWKGRAIALLVACAISLFFVHSPIAHEKLVVPALLALLVATFLGAPVFTAIGGAADRRSSPRWSALFSLRSPERQA